MDRNWEEGQPIYLQLKERVLNAILDGGYEEGEALPSVRKLAVELQINHLTVGKAYQELVDEEIVEKKRGLGMFVRQGAKEILIEQEKQKFLTLELPNFLRRIEQLNINKKEIIQSLLQD